MIPLAPSRVARIATDVYGLEHQTIGDFTREGNSLGCEGLFKVENGDRFNGKTGGRLWNRLSGFGYIGEGEGARQGEVLIVFRGTNPGSGRDWLTDFRAGICQGDTGLPVHIGFQKTWESFAGDIRLYLHGKNPTHIYCIGHSLGGALATLCAGYLASNRVGGVSLYTLAAPRVGTRQFAELLTERLGVENIYRVTHVADPVAVVPIYPFFHAPYRVRQYVVGGMGIPINPFAHGMAAYSRGIGPASWSSLLDRSTTMVVADEVRLWLDTVAAGGGVVAFSVDSLAMIGKALGWVLQQAYEGGGLGLCYGLTALDHLGYMIERGTKFSSEADEQLKTLMNAILRFIGRSAVVVADLTLVFVRYVLELFYSTIQTMALQALRGTKNE